jgi:hypothetical protein
MKYGEKKTVDQKSIDMIKIVHANEIINFTNIRTILREPSISKLLPGNNGTRNDKVPIICDKQVLPMSTLLCNFSKIAKEVSEEYRNLKSPNECLCTRIVSQSCTDLLDGHIISTNYNFLTNKEIRNQFFYGSQFKCNLNIESIKKSLELGLNEYVTKIKKNISQSIVGYDLEKWKEEIMVKCMKNVMNNKSKILQNIGRNAETIKYIKLLKDNFAITKVDKLSHNIAFTCKNLYLHNLYKEFNSAAYEHTEKTYNDIMISHKNFNLRYNYKINSNLPYLYAVPKLHKSPPKFRYIAGVSSSSNNIGDPINLLSPIERIFQRPPQTPICSTTAASRKLSGYLRNIMFYLKLKDKEIFLNHGYRRCWFVTNIDDVFKYIKQNIPVLKGLKPRTFDFTQMYTMLEHEKILKNVKIAVEEAITYKNNIILLKDYPILPTIEVIMDHVQFIISNTFISNDLENIRQQKIGIPMGTNASPELANLTLYVDEASFIDNLIAQREFNTARKYSSTQRYIDDLLLWDLTPPPVDKYNLQYSEQFESINKVSFLGATLESLENGHIIMSIYDKTLLWNFPVVKFTHGLSNVPKHQIIGTILSQLIRYRLICNSIKQFKIATTRLVMKLFEREQPKIFIIKGWKLYLKRYQNDKVTSYEALRRWFKKMFIWSSYNFKKPVQFRTIFTRRKQ